MFLNLSRANARITELEAELANSAELVASAKALAEQNESLLAEVSTLRDDFNQAQAENEQLAADATASSSLIESLTEQVTTLEADAKSAAERAAEIAASQGIEVDQLPSTEAQPLDPAAVAAQFRDMPTGPERTAFFQQHRKALLG
jgi:chromosome segregation ATPase